MRKIPTQEDVSSRLVALMRRDCPVHDAPARPAPKGWSEIEGGAEIA